LISVGVSVGVSVGGGRRFQF